MYKSLNEECGVFGIFGHSEAARITYYGLHSLQHRGQEAAGIVVSDGENVNGYRGQGLVSEVFNDDRVFDKLKGNMAIGHVRYATSGSSSYRNIQPFLFQFHDENIAIAHNGNLVNAKSLKRELEKKGAIFHSTSDTEVLVHLIRRSEKKDFLSQLKEALCQIKGGFSFVLQTTKKLYGMVDTYEFRPLILGKTKKGSYILASETCALEIVGAEFIRNIRAGEIVIIDENGYTIEKYSEKTSTAIAAMEYVYFARPDSDVSGVNVHYARKKSGRRLAKEAPVPHADIIIGVPNSSLSAASGYAEEIGKPYEMGLIKNQYVARTFIQPTQELREQGVRMKLSAVKSIVKDKVVVMIDDSIVRGTTSSRIVQLLKEAGAKEVHVRIASPEFKFPIFYGIDVSNSAELISANKTVDEVCKFIGADSLSFLSVEGLVESIGLNYDAPYTGLCMECFTGYYPDGLGDYEEEFIKSLTPIQKDMLKNLDLENNFKNKF